VDIREIADILIHDAKFWTALLLLFQTILFLARPDFPPELWAATSGVLVAALGALTVRSTRAERKARRLAREV
jgi:hypothetical protein